jgi:hypothetical protein
VNFSAPSNPATPIAIGRAIEDALVRLVVSTMDRDSVVPA